MGLPKIRTLDYQYFKTNLEIVNKIPRSVKVKYI